jgi:polar amino acid transport system substrate-binding protein
MRGMRVSGRRVAPGGLRVASAVCVAVLVAGTGVGCGTRTTSPAAGTFTPATPGVLTVATSDVPSPGFWEGTASDPTGGFEYELARAIADRFGLDSVRIELRHFHRIVAGDLAGADLALDMITPTGEREQHLSFSTPYLTVAPTVLVRAGTSIPDLASAQSLNWGAIDATTFVGVIGSSVAPDEPVQIFDRQPQMMAALRSGQVDAVMFDLPEAVAIAEGSNGALDTAAQLPSKEAIAAALPKDSGNVQAVDSAIRAFIADGTVHDLLQEWVGPDAAEATSIPLLHTTLG